MSNLVCQCLQVKQVEPLTLFLAQPPFILLNITILFCFSVMGLNISTIVILPSSKNRILQPEDVPFGISTVLTCFCTIVKCNFDIVTFLYEMFWVLFCYCCHVTGLFSGSEGAALCCNDMSLNASLYMQLKVSRGWGSTAR